VCSPVMRNHPPNYLWLLVTAIAFGGINAPTRAVTLESPALSSVPQFQEVPSEVLGNTSVWRFVNSGVAGSFAENIGQDGSNLAVVHSALENRLAIEAQPCECVSIGSHHEGSLEEAPGGPGAPWVFGASRSPQTIAVCESRGRQTQTPGGLEVVASPLPSLLVSFSPDLTYREPPMDLYWRVFRPPRAECS